MIQCLFRQVLMLQQSLPGLRLDKQTGAKVKKVIGNRFFLYLIIIFIPDCTCGLNHWNHHDSEHNHK